MGGGAKTGLHFYYFLGNSKCPPDGITIRIFLFFFLFWRQSTATANPRARAHTHTHTHRHHCPWGERVCPHTPLTRTRCLMLYLSRGVFG